MPDTRTRRGLHPQDAASFAEDELPRLEHAVEDLSWLKGRGYSPKAALKLVGDRHALSARQRRALQRCAASNEECVLRATKAVAFEKLKGERVIVDGYNVILTLEAAISGGILLLARDGVMRDLASLSAHYRKLEVTRPAVKLLVETLEKQQPSAVECLLDRPISNSGRLKQLIEDVAEASDVLWHVRLSARTDRELKCSQAIVASADSAVIDACGRWVNLARRIVEERIASGWIVDLSGGRRA